MTLGLSKAPSGLALRVVLAGFVTLCLPATAQAAWQSDCTAPMATTCGDTATWGSDAGETNLVIDVVGSNLHHNRTADPGFQDDLDFDSDVTLSQPFANLASNTVVALGTQQPETPQLGSAAVPASQVLPSFTFSAGSGGFNTDTFTLENSADATARSYQIAPGALTGHGGGSITYSSGSSAPLIVNLIAGPSGDEIGVQADGSDNRAVGVDGGGGDDRVTLASGVDVPGFDGEEGTDTLSFAGYSSGATFALPGPTTSVENLLGGPSGDSLTGDGSGNRVEGAGGSDSLSGAGGDDVLAAVDGAADAALDCGPGGADVANIDAGLDPTPTGCETVIASGGSPPEPDGDGDGVPDTADACPNEAGPPSDNGCPTVPPVTDRDGDGSPDADDRCPDRAGTASGCPEVDRELTIKRKRGAYKGKMVATPDEPVCEADQKVTIFRKAKGADPKIGNDRTNGNGAYEVDGSGKDGKYYARATETDEAPSAVCLESKSKNLKLG